ncbi:hypothetical protein RhiirA5_500826 [Rhizophagus irregularis]|uniref:F-box domain-containing protein n=1 Tax=Rhizophagus irregularis TaxID=588596 RepID=A0A2N0NZQ7_9GLOM|nr:hypothetical protein RhiirA5_505386 [Rhizophagus irregularis]PKC07211.1 hypothetical protein RhiirA5_500826 [Rhizophagus irregularis]
MNSLNTQNKVILPGKLSIECFEQVLTNLKDDPGTLFSCLLVNRCWCRLSVPLLWSHPFEYHGFGELAANIIQVYISCLPVDELQILIDEGLDLPECHPPLFDYPRYLQSFESAHFTGAIMSWLSTKVNTKTFASVLEERDMDISTNTYIVQTILGNLLFSRSKGIKDLDIVHFDEDDDSLIMDITTFDDANKALSRLEKLQFDYSGWSEQGDKSSEIISNLFDFMTQSSHNIQHIYINITNISDQDFDLPQIAISISNLIKSQNNLRDLIMLEFWTPDAAATIFDSLPSQSNSLTYLRLHDLYQDQYLFLLKILPTLKNLETLQLINLHPDIDEPFRFNESSDTIINLKNLHYQEEKSHLDISTLIGPIIRMANLNLRSLSLASVNPDLVEIIRQYCPNLTHLSLTLTTPEIPISVSNLLSTSVFLRHFSIYIYSSEFPFLTTEELLKFSRSFPKSILYFGFYLAINSDILNFFLKECPASFQVLSIYRPETIEENLLKVIINYAKDKKSLKKLLLDSDVDIYSYEGSVTSATIQEARSIIPIIDGTIEHNRPYSGSVMDDLNDRELWDSDLTPLS